MLIDEFKFWCQHVLPLVYDDSLSYYEVLCKMADFLNRVITEINTLNTTLDSRIMKKIEEYLGDINNRFDNLKKYVDTQDSSMLLQSKTYTDNEILGVYNKINEIINQINSEITVIYEHLDSLKLYIDAGDIKVKGYVDIEIARLQEEINNLRFTLPNIYNPVTGTMTSIDQAINDVFSALKYGAITAIEFDNCGITAGEFDKLNITALEFDINAKNIICAVNKLCDCLIFSPFTGIKTNVAEVIYEIVQRIAIDNITAGEFDGKKINAGVFDSKKVTAYNFDFDAKNIFA